MHFGGMGFIPVSEIKSYLELFPVHDAEKFLVIIQAIDVQFVSRNRE